MFHHPLPYNVPTLYDCTSVGVPCSCRRRARTLALLNVSGHVFFPPSMANNREDVKEADSLKQSSDAEVSRVNYTTTKIRVRTHVYTVCG